MMMMMLTTGPLAAAAILPDASRSERSPGGGCLRDSNSKAYPGAIGGSSLGRSRLEDLDLNMVCGTVGQQAQSLYPKLARSSLESPHGQYQSPGRQMLRMKNFWLPQQAGSRNGGSELVGVQLAGLSSSQCVQHHHQLALFLILERSCVSWVVQAMVLTGPEGEAGGWLVGYRCTSTLPPVGSGAVRECIFSLLILSVHVLSVHVS